MPHVGAVRKVSLEESPEVAGGSGLCSVMESHAADEISMEEAIRRCCNKFALNLIDEIRRVTRRGESEASMHQRWSGARSLASILASPEAPLVGRNGAADLVIDDDHGDGRKKNADDVLLEAQSTTARSSVGLNSDRASSRTRSLSGLSGSPASIQLDHLTLRDQRDLDQILRAARLSRLSRQVQDSALGLRFRRFAMKEDTLDFIMGVLVLVNLAQLGLSTDFARDWQGWLVVDCFFALAFLIEFLLKILMRGVYEHLIVQWKGTLFDVFIVLAALVELVASLSGEAKVGGKSTPGAQSFTVIRVVRLLRLVRIVKALRLPMFKDLLRMCEGLVGGSQTLVSSIILLMVPIYSAALLMRETVGKDEANKELVKPFSSLPWSFFTTFRCIMGDCAAEGGQPLPELLVQKLEFGWLFGLFYVGVILMTCLGLFNVIIALYVEQIVVSARRNESLQKQRRLGDVKRLDLLLAGLIHEFVKAKMVHDADRDSRTSTDSADVPHFQSLNAEKIAHIEITKDLFDQTISNMDIQDVLDQLGIPSEDRWNLFDILDADGSASLQLGEIVEGLKRLRGEPRRSDIVANGLSIRAMQRRVHLETDSIFTVAKRTAVNIETFRQDHIAQTSMILDRLGALEEVIGGSAKVMPSALGHSASSPRLNDEANENVFSPREQGSSCPHAQHLHRNEAGVLTQLLLTPPSTP